MYLQIMEAITCSDSYLTRSITLVQLEININNHQLTNNKQAQLFENKCLQELKLQVKRICLQFHFLLKLDINKMRQDTVRPKIEQKVKKLGELGF